MFLACQNSNGFLDMAKQRPALVKDRPSFKGAYLKALGDGWVFGKYDKAHVMVDGLLFFYAGGGLELKQIEKGKIVLPKGDFISACATWLRQR